MQKEKLKIETLTCQKYRKTNSVRKASIETENGNATQAMKFLRTTASCFLLSRLASAKWEKSFDPPSSLIQLQRDGYDITLHELLN